MTINQSVKKNKIILSDYDYRQDIENRTFISKLSPFEVEVLTEIVHSSIKFPVNQLMEDFDLSKEEITPILEKLAISNLFSLHEGQITVDKEKRKAFEILVEKFDEDFKPDLSYLRLMLSQIPIHILPNWYAIPRASDDIFQSIVEKNFITPKTYTRYLSELQIEDETASAIADALINTPSHMLLATDIIDQYELTREEYEEVILLLEYHLVGTICYKLEADQWKEYVVPFYEWQQYLEFLDSTQPKCIDESDVERKHEHDFGFVIEINKVISALIDNSAPLEELSESFLHMLNDLKLVEGNQDNLQITDIGKEWINLTIQDQAISLYRCNSKRNGSNAGDMYIDKGLRELKRALERVMRVGWVKFDDFIKSLTAPIGSAEPVSLVKKGRRWSYDLPSYSDEDIAYIRKMLEELFEAGMVALGVSNGDFCFCVTPFGRMTIEE